ncbi:MAG: NTP transferase domain-containing protein, partial [Nitrosomonas sp.]|nr:NTP transferase domain-containing protein [Nitrosomonas sp.]
MSNLNIVILAAGMGKRMQSSVPKVLHRLGGKPLLRHVIDTARALSPRKICVVHGYGGEMVREHITDKDIIWVEQVEQLGTGHALMQALTIMDQACATLVLYGDVPLVKISTLQELIDAASNGCGLLTANLESPKGYGRIIREVDGNDVMAIVEEKDATNEQKQIAEINTGVMVVPDRYLLEWLPKLKNANQQAEYYLTDIISMSVKNNVSVTTAQPSANWEILGVNSKVQLESLERIYQGEIARKLL